MSKKVNIYVAEIPSVSREYALDLEQRFPAIEVKPDVDLLKLMYNAGQRSVVEFVKHHSVDRIVTSDPTQLRAAKTQRLSFIQRLFRGK